LRILCETSTGLQKFTASIGDWLGWSQPAGTVEMAHKRRCCSFTAENLVDAQRDAPMRGSTITRAVILGQKHRPMPVRGPAGDRIAVDRHADAGGVLTVCLRANHTACSHHCGHASQGRSAAGTGDGESGSPGSANVSILAQKQRIGVLSNFGRDIPLCRAAIGTCRSPVDLTAAPDAPASTTEIITGLSWSVDN
jgi:hypothetical protein